MDTISRDEACLLDCTTGAHSLIGIDELLGLSSLFCLVESDFNLS